MTHELGHWVGHVYYMPDDLAFQPSQVLGSLWVAQCPQGLKNVWQSQGYGGIMHHIHMYLIGSSPLEAGCIISGMIIHTAC